MNKIIITEDGSHSLYNEELNETYHSFHGAIQESKHVFIQSGLEAVNHKSEINILEVGFGTGLNALLSTIWATENERVINYHTIEAYPLASSIISKLNYAQLVKKQNTEQLFDQIHSANWNASQRINEYVTIKKIHSQIEDFELQPCFYDLIYFDAFAPSKQPEMWSLEMLEKVTSSMAFAGVFVTYCAQGQLKRNLKALGLAVETIQGPPGKKEMVRGVKE